MHTSGGLATDCGNQFLSSYPQIDVAGSRENVAFVRGFRASGGDAKQTLQTLQAVT